MIARGTLSGAYDVEAAAYDARLQGDAWMRNLLWERYARLFRPGDAVLDAGCGTGIDAEFLARVGVRVVGIDASPPMIVQAKTRLGVDPLKQLVELRVLDLREIESLPAAGFDGIISAFASLSTVADLGDFAQQAASRLRPRGAMLLHLLNRSSLWEWLGLVRQGRLRAARHLGRHVERDFVIGGRPVRHYLYHAREAYARFFAEHFRLRGAYGLGILRPPHTLGRLPPAFVMALDRLEQPVRATRPFVDWGRFFVLELEKR
jgi:SAM-dependent methyltransferase